MTSDPQLTDDFEAHRGRLVAIATRVVGDRAEAEDLVQEAWLRLSRQPPGSIDNLGGWLTTVVGRLGLDALRARAVRPRVSFDAPERPIVVTADVEASADDPADAAVAADAVGVALLTVLGSLGPDERLAFVLHDLFAVPFAEIGELIDKSPDAAKMAASRARRKVQGAPPAVTTRARERAVVDAFMAAARDGDFTALLDVLHPDLVWNRHMTMRTTTTGRDEVVQTFRAAQQSHVTAQRVRVNGQVGVLVRSADGRPLSLMACTIEDGRMTRMDSLLDGRRLAELDLPE